MCASPQLSGICAGAHAVIFYSFMFLAVVNTITVHSGYHLPFVYPSPERHDFHHESQTNNFGVLGFFDWLYGTDRKFRDTGRISYDAVLLRAEPLPRRKKTGLSGAETANFFRFQAWDFWFPGPQVKVE